jgi:hypothetical protein
LTNRRTRIAAGLVVAAAGLGVVAWLFLLRGGVTPSVALGAPRFIDEAASSGLVHTYDGDSRFYVGGGLATFDCDDDGRPELYLAGGADPAALFHNDSAVGGALSFTALPGSATDLVDVTGAYALDVDGDELTDLAVLRAGETVLLRGLGDCRFERANERWAFDGGDGRTMAFSATWEGSAALPTLALGDYIALDELGAPQPPCPDNRLVRPAPDGTRYAPSIGLSPGYCALSMLFSDWDRSGRRDLRVTNDRQYYTNGEEQLWRIVEGEVPRLYTDADGWVRMQIWGMGIASQDLTGDGYPEVYLTSQGDNKLQTLTTGPDQPMYRDVALQHGVNVPQPVAGGEVLPSTAWHPEFADVNNDGFVDLFVSKGNVSEQEGYATRDPSELLLGAPDGTFRRVTEEAGILSFARGRGAALADLNLDGRLDLVEVNLGAPVGLWRNLGTEDGDEPHWLALQVEQPGPNHDAIGAWLEVRIGDATLLHEVTVGGGHASGQLGWIHVGLGPSSGAEARITWPDGTVGPWQRVDADEFAILERDAAEPRTWEPPS